MQHNWLCLPSLSTHNAISSSPTHPLFPELQLRSVQPAGSSTADADGSKGGALTLQQCLTEHTKEEVLDAGNEVYCSRCKAHRGARKVVRFCRSRLPDVLVLSLKRFEFRDISGLGMSMGGMRGGAHREKIDAFVDFPIDGLDVGPFCHKVEQSEGGNPAISTDRSTVYDLFAVCNHYGRMGFGHYTAAARDWEAKGLSQEWYAYDDNDVSGPCTPAEIEAEVHSRNAYILFYRRRGSRSTLD